jgi:ribosome-binding factor A
MKSKQIAKQMVIKRANKELIVNINMFLLLEESLRGLFWNVAAIDFNPGTRVLKIGITTTDNKLGTTLEKLRKNAKALAQYLFETGSIHCRPRIYFSVYKEAEAGFNLVEFLETITTENQEEQTKAKVE